MSSLVNQESGVREGAGMLGKCVFVLGDADSRTCRLVVAPHVCECPT